jgi:glucose/arabinose dehydrogenase
MFVSVYDSISEITPGGAQSTLVSGLGDPRELTFDNAGNLFVANGIGSSGYITEITPGGVKSTFASGLNSPYGVAFDSAGDLFEADSGSGNIYEFINNSGTLSSSHTLFASGLNGPWGLAFNSAGDLFVGEDSGNSITEITPGGVKSTFASGLGGPIQLAFQPVPEPSTLALLAVGMFGITLLRRHQR